VRPDISCLIHSNGAPAARLVLQDEALLLSEHALLQKS
jgi:hypothetical protein